jgi:hypothetical protein
MYDSLPMALFRSTRLESIMNASVADSDTTRKYRPWFAFFLPWILPNEVFSHPRADTLMRLTGLKMVYLYFLLCNKTLRKKSSP